MSFIDGLLTKERERYNCLDRSEIEAFSSQTRFVAILLVMVKYTYYSAYIFTGLRFMFILLAMEITRSDIVAIYISAMTWVLVNLLISTMPFNTLLDKVSCVDVDDHLLSIAICFLLWPLYVIAVVLVGSYKFLATSR